MSPAAWALSVALVSAGSGTDPGAVQFHVFLTGTAHVIVHAAVEGAAQRLSKPACQRVLDDFRDDRGDLLSTVLASKEMTHVAFLSSLLFVDAESDGPCQAHTVVAFTRPRERVIRVCASRFTAATLANQKHMEIVIIHELLHALGLGENPPTSAQITAQVMSRCGR